MFHANRIMLSTPDSESVNKIYYKPILPGHNSYFIKNNAALPLWRARNMFDKEYLLQVEVLADQEVPFEKSTDDILNMNTYTCHICGTEVPKAYTTEHNEGDKHKTFMKIADLALERSRKHMKLNIKERLSIQVRETYFCDPCAVVVQNVDKINHESSEKHVKSLRHDELLKDFMLIYEDKENIEYVIEKTPSDVIEYLNVEATSTTNAKIRKEDFNVPENIEPIKCENVPSENYEPINGILEAPKVKQILKESQLETENVSEPKPSKTDSANFEELSDMSQRMVDQLSDCLSKYFPEKRTNTTKAEKKGKSQKAETQLVNYLKSVTENCKADPIHFIEALTDKLILITAVNGDKIKVPVVNFHSIHTQKDKSYCKICENPDVGARHEYSEEHMEKIMIPIKDKNGIRKIDDIWSHCVLCNDVTKNINFQLHSLMHRNKLKHCLVDSATDVNENVLKPTQQKEDTSHLIQEHSLIAASFNSSEIICKICDVTIPNKVMSIKNHIKAFDHVTNYNTTIENNNLNEIDDLEYYCVPCDMCVAKRYALGHCNGKKHNKHLTDMINRESEVEIEETQIILPSISQQIKRQNLKGRSQNDSELICFVCNIVLYNVDKHMNSLDHKRNYFSYLEANKLNEIEEDTFYCIPCNTVILIDYLMNHCTSKKHKSHLKNFISNAESQEIQNGSSGQLIAENSQIFRSISQSVQNSTVQAQPEVPGVSQNGVFDTAIPLKFLYQFREMSNTRKLLCTICDEEVPYRKYEVQTHVNLIDHIVAFNLMMLWNKIKRLNDKYYCDVCKVDVTYFNELSHVTSAPHVTVMTNQPKGTVYEYDRRLLTLEYAMSHKVGDRVRPSSIISVAKPKDSLI